ncbi:MAG: hypothetical protein ABSB40_06275 [Nitrososphaeria archaeon]
MLYRGTEIVGAFYITVEKNSPVAQANVDLAKLGGVMAEPSKCSPDNGDSRIHFVVNPKGYVVFHVSGGSGGYHVSVEKVEEDPRKNLFNSSKLDERDIFSAIIIRPGTYSVTNLLTKTKGDIVVAYPKIGKVAYRPPSPVRVECSREAFEPNRIELQPGQGMLYHFKAPSHIKIELLKPDDGPNIRSEPVKRPSVVLQQKEQAQNLSKKS